MSDQFEEWWKVFDAIPQKEILGIKSSALAGWEGHKESSKSKPPDKKYACFVDQVIGEEYADCVFDPKINEPGCCFYATELRKQGKTKTDCQHWKLIEE